MMTCLGNFVWIVFGGLASWIGWMLAGLIWCLTIVGIPVGLQCFKIASFAFAPFGKHLEVQADSKHFVINLIWLLLFGWELALGHLISAIILALTIVGLPFAIQQMKMVSICLAPFGKIVVKD
jgi:uncharacterized membrane protein YccF (DUF307 family)